MAIEIIPCEAADLQTLCELAIRTFDETFRPMNRPDVMDEYLAAAFSPDRIAGELADPDSTFRFVLHDGRHAGYLKLNESAAQSDLHDPDSLEIERIYVARGFQGLGLGKALIACALETARDRGRRYLWLSVWDRHARGIAFYEKMGFRPFGHHDFMMGSERQTDVLMRRNIPEE